MSTIKLVLWDIGNVLNHADHRITHRRLVQLGVPLERAEQFYANTAYGDFARGKISGDEFYRFQIDTNLGVDLTLDQIIDAHNRHMYQADKLALTLPARCMVPIAFATSTNVWQNARERELIGDVERFNPVWTFRSNEHGLLKTDPGCMALIADELCRRAPPVHASQILFIDDSAGNRLAAERVGMQTFPYAPNSGAVECEAWLHGLELLS